MRILHEETPFSEEEKKQKRDEIRTNVKESIITILNAMPIVDPPVRCADQDNEARRAWILSECSRHDFEYPPQFWEATSALWKDPGVQECFERSNEYQLIDCAKYFLDRVEDVRKDDFSPTHQDILRCRVLTSGIFETKFRVDKVSIFHFLFLGSIS